MFALRFQLGGILGGGSSLSKRKFKRFETLIRVIAFAKSVVSALLHFVPRFGSALNFNQYLHMLMLDGVYIVRGDGAPCFMPAPRLTDAGVTGVCNWTISEE